MPDARGAYGAENRSKIISACERLFELHADNCSGFVKAVVKDLTSKELLTGQANNIYDQIQQDPWVKLGTGINAQMIAGIAASEGNLVVAATKSSPNGHVAIIVDSNNNAFKGTSSKAIGYWGRLGSRGYKYMPISNSWSTGKFPDIVFAFCRI